MTRKSEYSLSRSLGLHESEGPRNGLSPATLALSGRAIWPVAALVCLLSLLAFSGLGSQPIFMARDTHNSPLGGAVSAMGAPVFSENERLSRFSRSLASFTPVPQEDVRTVTIDQLHSIVALGCPGKWNPAEHEALVFIAKGESGSYDRAKKLWTFDSRCVYGQHIGIWQFDKEHQLRYGLTLGSSHIDQAKAAWDYGRSKRYRGSLLVARRHKVRTGWW